MCRSMKKLSSASGVRFMKTTGVQGIVVKSVALQLKISKYIVGRNRKFFVPVRIRSAVWSAALLARFRLARRAATIC